MRGWNTHRIGASALSPKITLQLHFPDRAPETVTLGPGRTMVGRESGDILLNDPEASALHAEIEFTKGAVIVRDLGSRNGTWREGKRLPQFALFRGQSFRCGTTDITLVEIEGAATPIAGGTAAGRQQVAEQLGESSSTLASSSPTSARTLVHDVAIPSSTATDPATHPVAKPSPLAPNDSTLVGPAPPPTGPGAVPPSTTRPAFEAMPTATPVAPAPAAPFAAPAPFAPAPSPPFSPPGGFGPNPLAPAPAPGPVASGGTAPGIPVPAPAAASAPVGVPTPVAAAASAPLAPVANAVIKLGDARPKSGKHRAPVDRSARMRLLKRVLMGSLVVAIAGGLAFGIYSMLAGRNQAFLRELAREMPQDTVGVLALSSPRAVLELFGSEITPEVREEATKDLGLDPFDAATFEAWGFDVDAPLGVSLLDGDGMVAVSVGVKDPEAMRSALASKAAALIKAPEDLRWIERSFGDVPGLWLDEPISVAALLPGKRVIFVLGGDAETVARHAKRVAEAKDGETLADRSGFGELEPERGKLLLAMYVDGGSGRAALPGDGLSVMAGRMALADIDGFALMVADDGPRVHLSVQTIMREGMDSLTAFESVRRKGEILEKIPAPVLAELDGVFAPESFGSILGSSPLGWGMGNAIEDEFRKETGLDLRVDLIDNLDGQLGWTLRKLPGKDEDRDAFAMLAFAGVKDEEAAKRTAERFFGKMQGELDLALEQIEGVTVYVRQHTNDPKVTYFVHGGVAWATLGDVDVAQLIKGGGEPFRRKARIPAIEDATAPGGLAAGFVDIHEILAQVRARLDEGDIEELDTWSPVFSPLEALTMRSELSDRTFVVRWTLHTSGEHALAGLVQGLTKVVGAELAKKLARKRRRERCDELIEHILELMKGEIKSQSFEDQLLDRRFELQDECNKPDTTDTEIECMMGAKSLQELARCEEPSAEADDGGITPVDVLEQPEPAPVPYVEDIWPNTEATGTATGKPDAQVNYAVPLGPDPAARGPDDALVTVVMFGDFQCPHCKRVLPTLDQLLASDREVRLVFRHNPLTMHTEAEIAARAALAAAAQGKFWPMHDKLFDNQNALTEDNFRRWAGELGLDLVRYDRDYGDAATAERVRADTAIAKKFGAPGTPAFFVNGRYLGGAQPLHAFIEVVNEEKARAERFVERRGNTRKRLYADMIEHFAPAVVSGGSPPIDPPLGPPAGETRHTIDTSGLPRRGSSGFVRVEIVECGDLDCPFCKRAEKTLETVLDDYDGKAALFWLHNPLAFHPGAEPAARAATAAGNQGKFWEMHDKLFEDTKRRSDSDFIGYARELGLDTVQFERELGESATAETVKDQQKICADNEARGTPTFFINGRLIAGAQPFDKFKEMIDQELAGGI